MNTEKTMKALNAARKVTGVVRQGGTASAVVVRNTMLQLEREGQRQAMPQTFGVLQHMLDNSGTAGEKMAMASFDEINIVREEVRRRMRPLSDTEAAAEAAASIGIDPEEGEDGPRPS